MPKKISDEDKRLAKVIQNIGAADRPKKLTKPKGAFPKVGGVGGTKFTGSSPMDKFQNFAVSTEETTETRKERFENPSRLYAAARKLGIPQKAVEKQINEMAKFQAKWGAEGERKSEDLSMEDMIGRARANAARTSAGLRGSSASRVNKTYKTY
jgi:hypothetical protein